MTKKCKYCKRNFKFKNGNQKYCKPYCRKKDKEAKKLTGAETQVILTGVFGDGCLHKNGLHYCYSTNCKYKKYILFKQNLLTKLRYGSSRESMNCGYKKSPIFSFSTQTHPQISKIANSSIENNLKRLNDLGVALWFFDDGSLHHKKAFYNLNTHKFSKQVHEDLLIPFFKDRYDLKGTLAQDRKKDGRHFYYLRFNKSAPSWAIHDLLSKYSPSTNCYKYKIISSETILKESREKYPKQVEP